MIQHLYQCTHYGMHIRWTALVHALRKCLKAQNTDVLLYISGKINVLPQFSNIALHSDILRIGWLSMILGIIPTSLARTQETYFTQIGKKTGLKWARQLITQIWRLIYGKYIYRSKLKHMEEALDNHTKELILDTNITDEHEWGQGTLPNLYNPYFCTHLSIILDTMIRARKLIPPNIYHQRDERYGQIHYFLLIQTSLHVPRDPIITLTVPPHITIYIDLPPPKLSLSLHSKDKNKW